MVESPGLATFAGDAGGSDQELVDQALAGRREATETLAQRHRQAAYLLALQLLGNRDDAMDVAQEAMLRFFASLGTFDRERRVQPWLFTIVRNQVRDLWRRRQRRPGDGLSEAGEALTRQLVDLTANRKLTCAAASSSNVSGALSRRSRPQSARSSCCATFTTCHTATLPRCWTFRSAR